MPKLRWHRTVPAAFANKRDGAPLTLTVSRCGRWVIHRHVGGHFLVLNSRGEVEDDCESLAAAKRIAQVLADNEVAATTDNGAK